MEIAMKTTIGKLKMLLGKQVTLEGWVHTIRAQKRMQFLILRGHDGKVQCLVDSKTQPELAATVAALPRESTVRIYGKVAANPQVSLGGIEVFIESIKTFSTSGPSLPIDLSSPTTSGVEPRMDWRFLDLRRPESRLIFEIQTEAEWAMRQYWRQERFIEIHTPKMMATASETGAELFSIDYFGGQAYLAQSPQFYKQMAMASGFDRVFEIAPVFRANPSFTSRHDTEFTSVDVELSWIDTHDDVMAFEEKWLQHVLSHLADRFGDRVNDVFCVSITVPTLPFPRIPMAEALHAVETAGHTNERRGDLDPAGERTLCEIIEKEFAHEFVFVTDYPFSVRPFYHMREADGERLTRSFDLLWKGLEVTTGAQREHRVDILEEQALEKGLSLDHIDFYLDFFRYGCPPHGGFGFGLTRMLMVLLGLPAVRETTFLTRTPNRLAP
jgi:nondiscriminating aspartyl-tRNA synthetase